MTFEKAGDVTVRVYGENPEQDMGRGETFDFNRAASSTRRVARIDGRPVARDTSPELSAAAVSVAAVPASGMKTARPAHRCTECGYSHRQVGRPLPRVPGLGHRRRRSAPPRRRCAPSRPARSPRRPGPSPRSSAARRPRRPTGVDELDRVLGGGLVPGAVLLLAGEPGVGKSTLLLEVAHRVAAADGPALVRHRRGVRGPGPAARRAHRRAARRTSTSRPRPTSPRSSATSTRSSPTPARPRLRPDRSRSPAVDGTAGGVTQVREVAAALIRASPRSAAWPRCWSATSPRTAPSPGPRLLEHLVDVVLHFEGDRHSTLRLVRAIKNRFGAGRRGRLLRDARRRHHRARRPLRPVPVPARRPGARHLRHRHAGGTPAAGRRGAGAGRVDSRRRLAPARDVAGWTPHRVAMVLAVLERRGGVNARRARRLRRDRRRGADHRAAADLAHRPRHRSARQRHRRCPRTWSRIGEVGLAGEVRRVAGVGAAARRGGPAGLPARARAARRRASIPAGMRLVEVADLGRRAAGAARASASRRRGRPRTRRADTTSPELAVRDPYGADVDSAAAASDRAGARQCRRRLPDQPTAAAARDPRPPSRPARRCATAWSASCAATPAG